MKTPTTCDEMRKLIGTFLSTAPHNERQRLWDIITCQRGPDSPSERGDMADSEASAAYRLRRERKRDTVEVIRAQSFGGVVGGAARYRTDINYVTLPPSSEWDHFDRHVSKAANALGLEVRFKKEEVGSDSEGCEVTVKETPPAQKPKTSFNAKSLFKTIPKASSYKAIDPLQFFSVSDCNQKIADLKASASHYKQVVEQYQAKLVQLQQDPITNTSEIKGVLQKINWYEDCLKANVSHMEKYTATLNKLMETNAPSLQTNNIGAYGHYIAQSYLSFPEPEDFE